jgi:multidrug resistance efflux pump
MSAAVSELNYLRKAHRVDLPLVVEIDGRRYRAADWSMAGVGVQELDVPLEVDQVISALCVLPMPDSQISLKVELQMKSRRKDVTGFEFHNITQRQKRVLRHYIESAIQGKIDNVEDLMAVVTTPGLATPIEEALNLTELEAESLFKRFRAKSYVSIGLGVLFLITVMVVLFYNTVYRIHATGLISGNIERVTANSNGVVKQIMAGRNAYIDAGTPLFAIEDPNIAIELDNIEKALGNIDAQIGALAEKNQRRTAGLVDSLRRTLEKKEQELKNARELFDRRIITIKDYSFVENQYHQAAVNHARAVEQAEEGRSSLAAEIEELQYQKAALVIQQDALLRRRAKQTVSTPVKGKVFHIEHAVGEYVTPNDVMVLIEKDAPPNVLLRLLTEDALKIRIGMDAAVYVPATDTEYDARVIAVGYSSVNSEATVTQEASLNETLVRLEFVDASVRLPANTRAKVWIKTL